MYYYCINTLLDTHTHCHCIAHTHITLHRILIDTHINRIILAINITLLLY